MPTLAILDQDGNFIELSAYYLVGKMLFPNDDKRGNDFVTGITMWAAEKAKHDPRKIEPIAKGINNIDNIGHEERARLIEEIVEMAIYNSVQPMLFPFGGIGAIAHCCAADSFSEKEADSLTVKAMISGWLLQHIIWIDQLCPPTSVNKAVFAAEKLFADFGDTGYKFGKSDRAIWSAWKEYKSVAHFWGAVNLWAKDIFPKEPFLWLLNEELFITFLRVANWYYNKAISIYPQGQKAPILEAGQVWEIPSEIDIEPIDIELNDNPVLVELLKGYRAPKRF